jgi:dTDP-4-dehydrorhamnose reductase
MAKILITGGKGQLGRAIVEAGMVYPGHTIRAVDLEDLDITNGTAVMDFIGGEQPDFVINCAAYTAVDKAEEEVEKATAINETGVKNLALAVAKHNARMIHVSTDYVFDGQGCKPYPVGHYTAPLSVYGQTKLAGEVAAIYDAPGTIIIRTSWLYHHGGKNFVNTIIKHATVKKQLQVVCDQTGSPTRASDLAEAILKVINSPVKEKASKIYHFANSGVASWYDFAKAIVTILNIPCTIHPIPTSQLKQAAPRPAYSVMDCSLIQQHYGISIPWWQDALRDYLTQQFNK